MNTRLINTAVSTVAMLAIGAQVASAAIISATGITGHHQGDSATGNGSILTTINKAGITETGGADSPTTWTHDDSWTTDWQGVQLSGASNAKIGWAVIDFGSAQTQLGDMLLWNVNESDWQPTDDNHTRGINTFNIYYSSTPTVAAPGVTGSPVDYDFASGGWTQLGATRTLALGTQLSQNLLSGTYDLSSIASAQYIGLEMLTNHGKADKVGFGEAVFVAAIPEPATLGIVALFGGGILFIRRTLLI